MTALTELRAEAAKAPPPGSELQALLLWAEKHIGDQFDRIHEMAENEVRLLQENEKQRLAIIALMDALHNVKQYVDAEIVVVDSTFSEHRE